MQKLVFISFFVVAVGCAQPRNSPPLPNPAQPTVTQQQAPCASCERKKDTTDDTRTTADERPEKKDKSDVEEHNGNGVVVDDSENKAKNNIKPPVVPEKKTNETAAASAAAAAAGAAAVAGLPQGVSRSVKIDAATDARAIEIYKRFNDGKLDVDSTMQLLFREPDFNRATAVFGELYRGDKLSGSVTADTDIKFHELGQKVSGSVTLFNKQRTRDHYSKLAGTMIVGALIGGIGAAGFLPEEKVPEFISAKMSTSMPLAVRHGILGAVSGAGIVFIGMETYHLWSYLAHPEQVYNADPLLDVPSTR